MKSTSSISAASLCGSYVSRPEQRIAQKGEDMMPTPIITRGDLEVMRRKYNMQRFLRQDSGNRPRTWSTYHYEEGTSIVVRVSSNGLAHVSVERSGRISADGTWRRVEEEGYSTMAAALGRIPLLIHAMLTLEELS